jgi:hypothetical protein
MVKRAEAFAYALFLTVALVGIALYYVETQPVDAKKLLGAYPELAVLAVPFSFLVLFGLYSLVVIVNGLLSFKDISASKAELDQEVVELRKDLKKRGVRGIEELRKGSKKL